MKKLVAPLLCLFGACGGSSAPGPAPVAVPNSDEPVQADEQAEDAERQNAVAEQSQIAEEQPSGDGAANEQQTQQDMDGVATALTAGQNPEGFTPCERAYNGAMAMVISLRQQSTSGSLPTIDRPAFMQACERLPETAQNCMVIDYAIAHQQDCQVAMQAPEVEELRRVMTVQSP